VPAGSRPGHPDTALREDRNVLQWAAGVPGPLLEESDVGAATLEGPCVARHVELAASRGQEVGNGAGPPIDQNHVVIEPQNVRRRGQVQKDSHGGVFVGVGAALKQNIRGGLADRLDGFRAAFGKADQQAVGSIGASNLGEQGAGSGRVVAIEVRQHREFQAHAHPRQEPLAAA